jgi:arylsulfatase A-like enzyme
MSTAPWTIPAVSSVLTGLYPVEHTAGQFKDEVANLDKDLPSALAKNRISLAEVLAGQYFRTAAFVSHPFFAADLGLDQGFQQVHNRQGWWKDVEKFWQWAERIKEPRRIFGYLHFMEAHHRHTRAATELDTFLQEEDPVMTERLRARHPVACEDPESRRCKQALVYEHAVLELRKAVASILQDLSDRGLLADTLVMLYSDHGEEFWDHETEQTALAVDPRGEYGLGHGQSMYQELLHVPLLAWHPGMKGARHSEVVSLIDVLPSITTWLDLDPELTVLQSREENYPNPTLSDISGSWTGKLLPPLSSGRDDDEPAFSSGIAYGPAQIASRIGEDKSIYTVHDQSFGFFDLEKDAQEKHPIVDDSLVLEFDTLTGDYLELPPFSGFDGPEGSGAEEDMQLSSEQLNDLKSIGYLQGVEDPEAATADPEVNDKPALNEQVTEPDDGDEE